MKKIFCATMIVITFLYVMPIITVGIKDRSKIYTVVTEQDEKSYKNNLNENVGSGYDKNTEITVVVDGTPRKMTVYDYLVGVVSAEMPASFPIEALKAQAVAARSYMLYKINSNHRDSVHEGAQLCDDFNHCTAFCEIDTEGKELWKNDYDYYLEKIRSAVSSTDGIVAMSDGKIIAAVFHSASDGATESAENVWGNRYSYLTAVPTSGGDASPNFYGVLEIGKKEFSDKMQSYRGDINLSENMTDWFKNIIRSESGNVMSITVGGVKLKGTEFRSILGLNSTNFTINIDADKILINTIGTGHGVGMSQYGARDMALKGAYFDEIICYYYSGVKLMVKN